MKDCTYNTCNGKIKTLTQLCVTQHKKANAKRMFLLCGRKSAALVGRIMQLKNRRQTNMSVTHIMAVVVLFFGSD